jgi:multiple sugar transport system substrate-binding protein
MRRWWRPRSCWLLLVSVFATGCQESADAPKGQAPSYPGITLRVGAVDAGQILAGVISQCGEWKASRGGDVVIRDEPIALDSVSETDILFFPAQRLGSLVDAGVLAKIPNEAVFPPKPAENEVGDRRRNTQDQTNSGVVDLFQCMDIAPAFREQVSRYGPDRLALPCGGSALVLVYRRDAFERASNKAAAQQVGLTLEPPATWEQLDSLAEFFHGRDWNGDGKPDLGIAVTLGTDGEGVGDATFLARAASLGQHRDHYSFLFDSDTMAPRIDTPPFVEALRGLVALKGYGPPEVERFDADRARAAFRTGNVALLIDRAERADAWSHGKPIGVAPLPGSDRVYEPIRKEWMPASPRNTPSYLPHGGGWLIGINAQLVGTQLDAALDFAKYLAGPENAARIRGERAFPMLPVRTSQMGQGLPDPMSAPDVDSRLWTDAVGRTLLAERVVPGLRIPQADGYLADLAKGRVAAATGAAAQQTLAAVAKAWTERTSGYGPKRMLWHYRRSLNSLVTFPQPPELGK